MMISQTTCAPSEKAKINEIQSDVSVEFPPFDFPQNPSHQLEVLLKFVTGGNFILTMCIKSVLNVS
jgi:hypothetical protein